MSNVIPQAALDAMFDVAPVLWPRFVRCDTCMAKPHDPCVQGGDSWPKLAHRVHAAREHDARVLHGTLWLLANGFESDVLGIEGAKR